MCLGPVEIHIKRGWLVEISPSVALVAIHCNKKLMNSSILSDCELDLDQVLKGPQEIFGSPGDEGAEGTGCGGKGEGR